MDNERQRQPSDPFDKFGGFGNVGGSGGSIFGRNPFDDPFFTRPFGSMLHSNNTLHESPLVAPPSGPIIKELGSDDDYEEEMETNSEEGRGAGSANEPFVDHPDDEVNAERKEQANDKTDYNQAGSTKAQSFKVHSCKVSYGGVDGVYYTSSATRRMGNDGMIMEDCKEADKRTGEATHRISRGLHDKGHSVSRKLKSDGKVNMSQTLHNLNEDELGSFEEAWKDKGGKQIPVTGTSGSGMDRMSDLGGYLLPSTRHTQNATGNRPPSNQDVSNPAGGKTKKIVRIPID
ncbi:Myeloid leukemia factor 1 [Bienertia sinuspersici]